VGKVRDLLEAGQALQAILGRQAGERSFIGVGFSNAPRGSSQRDFLFAFASLPFIAKTSVRKPDLLCAACRAPCFTAGVNFVSCFVSFSSLDARVLGEVLGSDLPGFARSQSVPDDDVGRHFPSLQHSTVFCCDRFDRIDVEVIHTRLWADVPLNAPSRFAIPCSATGWIGALEGARWFSGLAALLAAQELPAVLEPLACLFVVIDVHGRDDVCERPYGGRTSDRAALVTVQ
jgi:hypothetical protein